MTIKKAFGDFQRPFFVLSKSQKDVIFPNKYYINIPAIDAER